MERGSESEGGDTDTDVPPSLETLIADFESAESGAWATRRWSRRGESPPTLREGGEGGGGSRRQGRIQRRRRRDRRGVADGAGQGAAAAEELVQEVAAKLEKAEKRCRDLEWQVSMLVDKNELGLGGGKGQASNGDGPGPAPGR